MPNREMKTFTTRVIDSVTGVITAETFDIVDDKARDDLSNKISEPSDEGTNGQVLTTDGNGGRTWETVSTEKALSELSDVGVANPTDGQALVYDGTAEEWKNVSADSAPASGSSNFVTSGGVHTALADKVDKITGKGLSENDYTNADKAIVDGVTTALASKVDKSSVGTASGIAELDANGKVPSSQLPSYVDDVKEGYLNSLDGKFYEESTYETEITPEADKIYVDKATNITYRWSGSAFVAIGSDLALGETSTTAYRGDRGKAAYDHASDAGKISTATASGFYKVGATAEGHVSDLTAVAKADITALGIPDADDLGTAATKDSTSTITSGSTDLIEGGAVYTALQEKANSADLGTAASKDSTTTIAQDSTDLPEAGAIYNMLPIQLTWSNKTWSGLTSFYGSSIWTDGDNIYYSNGSTQYVLDKSTSTWTNKTWSGLTSFNGNNVWTDGDNIYFSMYSNQYVLDKSTSTWSTKTWNGFTNVAGINVWTDGDNIYCSDYTDQYVLDKSTSTWSTKIWSGLTSFNGDSTWTDGNNIYYSNGSNQYVLDKSTSTWTTKTWSGLTSISGAYVWTDGDNIYYSQGSDQYVLNKSTSIWEPNTWSGLTDFQGNSIWTDDDNIYCSNGSDQYILDKSRGFGSAATKDATTSVTDGSENLVTSGGVYTYVDTVITQALNGSY